MYNKALLKDFIVKQSDNNVVIKGRLSLNLLEKAGIFLLSLFILIILLSVPRILNSGLIMFFSALGALIFTYVFSFKLDLFMMDKGTQTLHAKYDKFDTTLNDISKFEVQEISENNPEQKLYRLKYFLKNGSTTSKFAFSTYSKAEELVKTLQSLR